MHLSSTKARELILLAGLLLLERKVPPQSISFLVRSYYDLADLDNPNGITVRQMSDNYGCTPQAGSKHAKILLHYKVLVRVGYRNWAFNWEATERLNDLSKISF
jgi:hypothetical protein